MTREPPKGILCPNCRKRTIQTKDSRPGIDCQRRGKRCTSCGARFKTEERIVEANPK